MAYAQGIPETCETNLYHVIIRGNNKRQLFERPEDYAHSSYGDYAVSRGSMLTDTGMIMDLVGKEQFAAWHRQEEEKNCLDVRPPRMTDAQAVKAISSTAHGEHKGQMQNMPREERGKAIAALLKKGIPMRQLSRLTGISKGSIEGAGKRSKR